MRGLLLILTISFALTLLSASVEGADGAGCKNGYCWAYCSPFADLYDWCYTTGGPNQDASGYARCNGNGESGGEYIDPSVGRMVCSSHWTCKGPCSL